jgi:hypothetical protein
MDNLLRTVITPIEKIKKGDITIDHEVSYKRYEKGKKRFIYFYRLNTRCARYIITKKKYSVNKSIDNDEIVLTMDEAFAIWDKQYHYTTNNE